ncbi:MAG: RNA methyltransferase [Kiloniellaceae bacterium]
MAGTDKTKPVVLGGPAVILVDPQLGENIGMAARAMLNCGLGDLRLVRPRDGWPNPAAENAASGAHEVLARARLFATTGEAVADLRRLYATTARSRDMAKPVVIPRRAAAEMRAAEAEGLATGVLFGPERAGLTNDDVALADAVIRAPLNPAFASLNLAQAVLLVGYEWFQASAGAEARALPPGAGRPATKAELAGFFERLERALDEAGFLLPLEKRPSMVRNLRTLFARAVPSEREVRTLHGILTALTAKHRK